MCFPDFSLRRGDMRGSPKLTLEDGGSATLHLHQANQGTWLHNHTESLLTLTARPRVPLTIRMSCGGMADGASHIVVQTCGVTV